MDPPIASYGSPHNHNQLEYDQTLLFDGNPQTCVDLRTTSCHAPESRIIIPWFTGRASYPSAFNVTVHYGNIFNGDDRNILVFSSVGGIYDSNERRVLKECVLDVNPLNSLSRVFSCGCATWCDVHIWFLLSPTVYTSSNLQVNLCEIGFI